MSNANTHEGTTSLTNPDIDRTLEIAYSSKQYRSLEAAGRMIDAVLNEHAKASDEPALIHDAQAAQAIFDLKTVYPEAFSYLDGRYGKLDAMGIMNALSVIIDNGGLPLRRREDVLNTIERISAEELEHDATEAEALAEAVWDTPPNEVFLDTFGISQAQFTEEPRYAIVLLRNRANRWHRAALRHSEDATAIARGDDSRIVLDTPKDQQLPFIALILELEDMQSKKPGVSIEPELQRKIDDAKRTPLVHPVEVRDLLLEIHLAIAEQATILAERLQDAYEMVLNGEASTFNPAGSPEPATS